MNQDDMARMHEPVLGAADLRELAGLTYRQLNDWEQRGALPSQRVGESGWRKVTPLQAVGLRIVANVKRRSGVPLTQLRPLLCWMLGAESATDDASLIGIAWLSAFPSIQADFLRLLPGIDSGELIESEALHPMAVADLVARDWSDEAAREFVRRFAQLSLSERDGTLNTKDVSWVAELAAERGDRAALSAVHTVASGVAPLWMAVRSVASGLPTYLVTDFVEYTFVGDGGLRDIANLGGLWDMWLVVDVTKHVNAVFAAIELPEIPVTIRASDIDEDLDGQAEETIELVRQQLRNECVTRIVVERKSSGFHVVYDSDMTGELTCEEEGQVLEALGTQDYQTLLIKKHNGRVTRVVQSIPVVVGRKHG